MTACEKLRLLETTCNVNGHFLIALQILISLLFDTFWHSSLQDKSYQMTWKCPSMGVLLCLYVFCFILHCYHFFGYCGTLHRLK